MISHKSRFTMQIKQGRLMNVKSLSLNQLRVSLSSHRFPTADAGRGWCLGTGHLLRNWIKCLFGSRLFPTHAFQSACVQSKGYRITHITKIGDLGVVWLGLRHTWGQYCHPSNTFQSRFMTETKAHEKNITSSAFSSA